jgi:selenocysteine-specific elongation factor
MKGIFMKHLILGTAGHIDHGKTSLVKALTGIDTDRLKEEKERGITIELGFAHLELPGGIACGIVDVPGHEKFVRTMVAGVGGIDLVMLVVAADEGIMPQTREHLEICQLLGVRKGVVVLTKRDMVDRDWLDLVTEEVREYLAGTFLEGAPLVPVSSRTGEGIELLVAELARVGGDLEQRKAEGAFRLPVDRVFTVTGFGTVVTGTLLSGAVSVGDEAEVLPSGRECRVRGVQTHGRKEERAGAGQRVAVNLQGLDHDHVARGDIVVPRGAYRTTRAVDVRLDHLPTAPRELRHRSLLRLHSATYEVPAQVILLDRDSLAPGESAVAQLRLKSPVLLLPGDPFVLRAYSPQTTVGGGRILDPFPPRRRRRSAEALELLRGLEEGDEREKLRLLARQALLSGISAEELSLRTGFSPKRLESVLAPLLGAADLIQAVREPRVFLSREAFEELKRHLLAELERYLRENPHRDGIGKEELKSRLPKRSDPRFFGPLLAALEKEGKAQADRELVKLPVGAARTSAGAGSDLRGRIEEELRRGDQEPPTVKELAEALKVPEKEIVQHLGPLVREGRGARVGIDLFYYPPALDGIREKLVAYLREKGEISPGEFREITGLSRKFMIPLLEHFDREKLTIRVGDTRRLRK